MYGWKPASTLPPETWRRGKPWNRGYFTNDGGVVSEADARALAAAIERALPDIPQHRPLDPPQPFSGRLRDRASLMALFAGEESRGCLEAFVEYCRRNGGFEIW